MLKRSERLGEVMEKEATPSSEVVVESETSTKPEPTKMTQTAVDSVKENGHCSPSESLDNGVTVVEDEHSDRCESATNDSVVEPLTVVTTPEPAAPVASDASPQTNNVHSASSSPVSSLSSSTSPQNTAGSSPHSKSRAQTNHQHINFNHSAASAHHHGNLPEMFPHLTHSAAAMHHQGNAPEGFPHMNHSAAAAHQHGNSPEGFSPNSNNNNHTHLSPRGNSPNNNTANSSGANSPPSHQHVVHVHINAGESFSVRVGEQVQQIPGKFARFLCLLLATNPTWL